MRNASLVLAALLAHAGVCAQPTPHDRGEPHAQHPAEATAGKGSVQPEETNREASGTSWQPGSTPMYAHHLPVGPWDTMIHYNLFLVHNEQGGPRGESQWAAVNWAMVMARRPAGEGEVALRGMLSLDPLTTAGDGYPLLFQTGETWRDEPLVDRQHPHDFLMELAARYDHPLSEKVKGFLYVAPSGEPALGPVAYPHRLSAWNNPLAPLGHHWQDSSHITFGVLTAGLYGDKWQTEISRFTGREPDEERWDIDPIRLDSNSARVTFNPNPHWSLSGSHGFLHSPEALHPEEDLRRTVLSAMFNRPRGDDLVAATAVWGRNSHDDGSTDSYLLEANYTRGDRHNLFTRVENVTKTGEELVLSPAERPFTLTSVSLGYLYDFYRHDVDVGLGGAFSLYRFPEDLETTYGEDPQSYVLFLRIRPAKMTME